MTRAEIIEGLNESGGFGTGSYVAVRREVAEAARKEIESLDLTPAQRAEKRLREACPGATAVSVKRSGTEYLASVAIDTDHFYARAFGSTPDEAVDRLLARVK